jgi:hypothetical protein
VKCPNCDNHEFFATQVVTGTITVVTDPLGNFLRNESADGELDPTALEYGNPEGPFECTKCHHQLDDLNENDGKEANC